MLLCLKMFFLFVVSVMHCSSSQQAIAPICDVFHLACNIAFSLVQVLIIAISIIFNIKLRHFWGIAY